MPTSDLSRRRFLQRFVAVGAVGLGSGSILAACGGGQPAPEAAAPEAAASASVCDLTGVPEQELAMRTQLQYVDVSPDPAKHCSGCALYVPPAEGSTCGGCTLKLGPVAPEGHCLSWAAKAT